MNPKSEKIVSELKKTFGELAGQDLSGADAEAGFLDLGLDSLFLTQAAAGIKKGFGVKVTFRQLNEDLSSFRALAEYIAPNVPDKAVTAAAAPAPAPSVATAIPSAAPAPVVHRTAQTPSPITIWPSSPIAPATGGNATALERVMKEQLRVMEMQLALLRGGGSPVSSPVEVTSSVPIAAPEPKTEEPAPIPPVAQTPVPQAQHGPFRQLDKGQKGGLTPEQQAHLDALTARYVSKTPKSKEYTARYRQRFADPRVVAGFKLNWKEIVYPIVATHSAGPNLWDLDGNKWVDVTMGFGVALLGHSPAFITEAVKKQLELGVEIGPQSPLAGEVAELICEFTGMERVTFCNTGSEAVMAALRICRTVTARSRIALFSGAYHGTFDEVLVKGALVNGEPKTFPIAPGIHPGMVSEVTVLEYGTPKSLEWIRQNAGDLAAVLVETVQSRHPDLQPAEFLREIRKITEASETPLIFDEVITGFRCHAGGAQAHFGIQADLATYGKIIGGGMPFGFIAGKAWLMNAFDGGVWQYGDDSVPPAGVTFFAGTFVRHPLAMAAAKAMLLHLKEKGPGLQLALGERTGRMIGNLNRYFEKHSIPVHLENFTSVWYPHFGPETKWGSLLYFHLREKGLHIWEGRPCFLSTAHSEEDIEFIERAFKLSVAEMQQGGFMPGSSDPEFAEAAARLCASAPIQTEDLKKKNESPHVSLTEGQLEMWLAGQMSPEAAGPHHASNVIHLKGRLDIPALEKAIDQVIQRHEALRCVFLPDGSEIVVASSLSYKLPIDDLRTLPPEEKKARADSILKEEGARLFDVAAGPLFAFRLIQLEPQEQMLTFTVQMIACDGWGFNIVLEEVSALYSAFVEGRSITLPPPTPMREYGRWQREQDPAAARQCEDYWRSQFKTIPPPFELPGFRVRPPARTFNGDRRTLRFTPVLYQGVKRTARELKSTPFALLLAAYETWLYRLSGLNDFVISVPFAGQSGSNLEGLVGQAVHTLPLRAKLEDQETFANLVARTKTALLDAQEHWNYSFGKLVQQLDLPHDPSRIPLVSVMFNLDPPMSKVKFSGCDQSITACPRRYFQYDLGFNLVDEGDTLLVECDFNTDLFDEVTITQWLAHFQRLIEGILANPQLPTGRLPLLTSSQREERLGKIPSAPVPERAIVHQLFSTQATVTPDSIAVESRGRRLSYRELDARSNQLAALLHSLGAGPGTLVGLFLERTVDIPVALLGVLKAGAAYVPIDPDQPRERVEHILNDIASPVILTHGALLDRLPAQKGRVVCLDEDRDIFAGVSPDFSAYPSAPDDLAYVIYTSGSTGQPKGVEISHGALANFMLSMRREPGLKARDATLALTTLSFDIAALEILLPLTVGARSVIVGRDALLDVDSLAQLVHSSGVTLIQGTPATWRMLLDSGWKGEARLKVLCGGEQLNLELAERLLDTCGELWNMYGPTETTIWSTACRIKRGEPIVLGPPIANTQIYILDQHLEPTPTGALGEIHIGGLGLARRYRNDPPLTAQKFIANPFAGGTGDQLYKTGDLARYRPDGSVEFMGRLDFQVKLRGHRIELGEVESALRGHPQIRDVVVLLREDDPTAPKLAAYLTTGGQLATAGPEAVAIRSELREMARQKLPDYMLPSAFVFVDSLPRTQEGKTDRKALPCPGPDAFEFSESYVAPRTPVEIRLARVWSETLKLPRVGIRESFFDLGGRSLVAVSLFARIEREFGRKLPLSTLLSAPTVEKLAEILSVRSEKAEKWACLVPIQPNGSKPPLFLVHGAGGNVLLYRFLAEHLGQDQPLYGLQSKGLDGTSEPLKTIEEMARQYLAEIREVQPRGPYFLGGYCLGGTVAYEMGQLLSQEGEKAALIAMLDTYNFSVALKTGFATMMTQKIRFHLGNFLKLPAREMFRYFMEKVRVARDGELANLLTSAPRSTTKEEDGGVARAESGAELSVQACNDYAADHYLPKPYAGRLTLFKPQINYKFYPDPKMGWGNLALGGLEMVELPMNPHAMLVEPFVKTLAAELQTHIDKSRNNGR